jgi:streptogramin lyase
VSAVGQGSGPSVFVSYRRDDVPDATDRLTEALRERFGAPQVFMDVDGIEIGADFETVIGDWVKRCDVLLAVIGHGWLDARDQGGARRIDDPGDYVRLEIEAALDRDIRVIPVLIHGGQIPAAGNLPPTLAPLAKRNAIELTRRHWDLDVDELVSAIERFAGSAPSASQPPRAAVAPSEPDAQAAVAPPTRSLPRGARIGRRPRLALAGVGVLCAAVAALVIALASGAGTAPASVALRTFSVSGPPEAIAVGDGVLWDASTNQLTRINPRTGKVIGAPITYTDKGASFSDADATGLAVGDGSVWVANGFGNAVTRLSGSSGATEGSPIGIESPSALALGFGSLWIASTTGVQRVDPNSGTPQGAPIRAGEQPDALAAGYGAVWVANGGSASVSRINPLTGKVVGHAISVGIVPDGITLAGGFVWVANELNNTVTRIDPQTGAVVGYPIDVGNGPMGIAFGLGSVWTANYNDDTVTRIDAGTRKVTTLHTYVGHDPKEIVTGDNAVWVANTQSDSITRITLGG